MFEAPRQIRPVAVGAGDVGIGFAPLAQIDFSKTLTTLWRGKGTIILCALAALMLALEFGTAMRSDWAVLSSQLLYSLLYSALLYCRAYDVISLDGLRGRRTQ